MSSYFLKCEDYLDLESFHALVQKHLGEEMKVCLKLREDEYGGQFYVEGQSTRGIDVFKEEDKLVVKLPLLADYADYFLANLFLDIFHRFLGEDVLDEMDDVVEVREYFNDETIQKLRERDSMVFCHMLKNMGESLTLGCVCKDVVFGRGEADHFIQCQLDAKELTQRLTSYIGGVLWGSTEEESSENQETESPTN